MISKARNPQIQALRALAAVLVLIYHAKWLDGGYIGVDKRVPVDGLRFGVNVLKDFLETA